MASLDSLANRPNFFLIGAAKAGSSRLHFLLGQHPEVFTSSVKEPGYFDRVPPKPGREAQYIELFRDVGGAKAIGESSVCYSRNLRFPGTARRIFEFNPQARILYLVRHPLRRMESGWVQQRTTLSDISGDFCQAVKTESTHIVSVSNYWKQLASYREFFPDEQIKLIFFEEFIRDEAAMLRECFEFLQVDANIAVDCSIQENLNVSIGKAVPSPRLDKLRDNALFRAARTLFPVALKNRLRPILMEPLRAKPQWDEATWRWAIEQIEADTQQFLAHAGRPADTWDWQLKPEQKRGNW